MQGIFIFVGSTNVSIQIFPVKLSCIGHVLYQQKKTKEDSLAYMYFLFTSIHVAI